MDSATETTIPLPWYCLTCGYGEVPGEDFNRHECDDFRAQDEQQQKANADAHRAEIRKRLGR